VCDITCDALSEHFFVYLFLILLCSCLKNQRVDIFLVCGHKSKKDVGMDVRERTLNKEYEKDSKSLERFFFSYIYIYKRLI
jgi:hypothetical protein